MLAKTAERFGHDWDKHLPYVLMLIEHLCRLQHGSRLSFLLYGRDPTLPTLEALSHERSPYTIHLDDYKTDLMVGLSSAWNTARECIEQSQECQKFAYDKAAKDPKLELGKRVIVHMPSEVQGRTSKFARPFHGPFRILGLTPTNAEVRLVDEPRSESFFVSLSRVRKCHDELPDHSWRGSLPTTKYTPQQPVKSSSQVSNNEVPYTGPVT